MDPRPARLAAPLGQRSLTRFVLRRAQRTLFVVAVLLAAWIWFTASGTGATLCEVRRQAYLRQSAQDCPLCSHSRC